MECIEKAITHPSEDSDSSSTSSATTNSSLEGEIARSLFREVNEEEDDNNDDSTEERSHPSSIDHYDPHPPEQNERDHVLRDMNLNLDISVIMGNIQIAQKKGSGGTISEILWPAAEYLATFLFDFANDSRQDANQQLLIDPSANSNGRKTAWEKDHALRNLAHVLGESCIPISSTALLASTSRKLLPVIELGAGVGLTGIKIASELPSHVILTDLEEALPLLQYNVALNSHLFQHSSSTLSNSDSKSCVESLRLEWGNEQDIKSCYEALQNHAQDKILILASDCVYFQHLHSPLENTITTLLSYAPLGSICLMASVRRWKKDTMFYSRLGKKTIRLGDDLAYRLRCTCIHEVVKRPSQNRNSHTKSDENDNVIKHKNDKGGRNIMRIYAVQLVPKEETKQIISVERKCNTSTLFDRMTTSIYILFGKPGAGKSSISEAAMDLYSKKIDESTIATSAGVRSDPHVIHLDLDVCIPSWMKDNFVKGVYPTLEERNMFAMSACDYVHQHLSQSLETLLLNSSTSSITSLPPLSCIISFSFVNSDLRRHFMSRFPKATWILVDVPDHVADERIMTRKGHFYKGSTNTENESLFAHDDESPRDDTSMNSKSRDWMFSPVDFDHICLDGLQSIPVNALRLMELVLDCTNHSTTSEIVP